MITNIPLNKLVPSPRNVRRSSDAQADLQLKADIEARGLLQNLVVTSVTKPRGCFAVEAGGRRLRALQALATDGRLKEAQEVSCLVLNDGLAAAQEASLAENFQHLRMNPADECLAFQHMTEQGADAEGIARRFGLTTRFVEGRLRLAKLAPVVFEALGAGEISLDVAKAYAATPDQERQAYVFEQMGRGYSANHPDSIRRMMTQATVSAADRRARFVGEAAYVEAGGRIERDLFADDAATRWLDPALLERLAGEKLDPLAAETAAELELGFVRATLDSFVGYEHTEGLRRVPLVSPALTEAERARVDELEAQIDALVDLLQNDAKEEQAREDADAKHRALSDEVDGLLRKPPVLDDGLKAQVGAFLLLDDQGRPKLDSCFYTEAAGEGEGEGDGAAAAGDDADDLVTGPRAQGMSQRLIDELAMQRRDILAVHIAADPALALDLAIFLMADRDPSHRFEKSGSSLVATAPSDPVSDFKMPAAAATMARADAAASLDRSWADGETRAHRFDAFRALPEAARAAWLGYAVSRTLEASLRLSGARFCPFHDHLGQLIGIDVAAWWRPTGANFFDRVPKSVTLAALSEVGGEAFAARYTKAKKAELAQSCERIFSGDFIAEIEVKDAARSWVPNAMRFAVLAGPNSASNEEGLSDPSPGSAGEGEAQTGILQPEALQDEVA